MKVPSIGEIWTHFKGGQYVVTGFCWDASGPSLVLCVLYRSVNNGTIFSRPIDNFLEPIRDESPRFQYEGAHADDLAKPGLG